MSSATAVRAARVEDAAALLAMERSCAEAPHWPKAAWAQVLAPVSYSVLPGAGPVRRCFVAERAGQAVGFVVASVAGTGGMSGGWAEMESLVVQADARRLGMGRSLCLQAVWWAQTEGAEQMQLEVRSQSVAALALYHSLGFVEQGRRRRYYADPADDAVLMVLGLGAAAHTKARHRQV